MFTTRMFKRNANDCCSMKGAVVSPPMGSPGLEASLDVNQVQESPVGSFFRTIDEFKFTCIAGFFEAVLRRFSGTFNWTTLISKCLFSAGELVDSIKERDK